MPFAPWKEHVVEEGACTVCGMPIPPMAVLKDGKAYSHTGYFTSKPGRYEPCRKSTDR